MMYIATFLFDGFSSPDFGKWAFLSVSAVCLFAIFLPLVTWSENRRKERESFYKADLLRRLAESPAETAKAALELMREEEVRKQIKQREGLKMGGIINIGVGIGLTVMLLSLAGTKDSPYLVGMLPGMIGVAMLIYVYLLAEPINR